MGDELNFRMIYDTCSVKKPAGVTAVIESIERNPYLPSYCTVSDKNICLIIKYMIIFYLMKFCIIYDTCSVKKPAGVTAVLESIERNPYLPSYCTVSDKTLYIQS